MKRSLLLAALLLVPALLVAPGSAAEGSVRLVAFGDSSVTSAAQKNVDGALAEGARGYIGLGDYNYEKSASSWKAMFQPLTSKGAWMALGNHDDRAALGEFFPDGSRWSKNVHGVRIVALNGMSSVDTARLRSDLCNAPESVRIVIAHHNWWLLPGAHHPGSEFPGSAATMDAIMRDCGVDLVLAGHEHNYQRMMRNGIPYAIVGTGGRGIYPLAGVPANTVASCECMGRLLLDVSPSGLQAQFRRLDGSIMDTFAAGGSPGAEPAAPAPSSGEVAFSPKAGNEWWVQVAVSGPVNGVDARDTGGAWTPLAKKSWGDWAGSFRVEAGHEVQYRARTSDGRIVESCWHKGTTCATPATPPPTGPATGSATFTPKGGNAWWVQVAVSGAPTGVSARDTGGAWVALTKRSWGDWAGSFRVEPGHEVQYRATLADGQTVESCWHAHPAGTCASTAAPAPGSSFAASFSRARGNEWWVETDVTVAGGTLARVEARVDDGAWTALEPRSWGSWAKSVRAPAGSSVTFRAMANDGQESRSSAMAWPPS